MAHDQVTGLFQHFSLRPFKAIDIDDLVVLFDHAMSTERAIGPVPKAAWERFLALPMTLNGRGFRVAHVDGKLAGYAESFPKHRGDRIVRHCKIVVDPSYRRRRIGASLLSNLTAIEPTETNPEFQALIPADWPSGLAFAAAFGFEHTESEIGMRCTQAAQLDGEAPQSISITRAAAPVNHAADVALIHNSAYATDVSLRPYTAHEMANTMEDDQVWIALKGSHIVGYCRVEIERDLVWIEDVAVAPSEQNRGIGRMLLKRALGDSGVGTSKPAGLNVSSNNPAAISVYTRLGFVRRREQRRLTAPRSALRQFLVAS